MADALTLTCPACGVAIVAILNTEVIVDTPQLCYGCRALCVIDRQTLILRRPTEDEEDRFLTEPSVIRAITTLGEYHQRHGPPTTMNHPPDGSVPDGSGPDVDPDDQAE